MLQSSVLTLGLLLSTSVAAAMDVGQAVVLWPGAPPQHQLLPACAFDGKGTFLVVWQQGRKYFEGEDARVLAARIAADGTVLDGEPLALCTAEGSQERPRVAFAAGVFLVVWQDFRNGEDWDVRAARVRPDGKVLDADGIEVATGPRSQAMPDVAGGPEAFLVAWQDRRSSDPYEVFAALVPPNDEPRPAGGAPLVHDGKHLTGGSVHVARARDLWFLAWKDDFAWSVGGGPTARITRLLARVSASGDRLQVMDVRRAPRGTYGLHPASLAASPTRAFFATGGSQRSVRCAMGAMYDAATGQPIRNPNTETRSNSAGWNTEHAIVLLEPLVPGVQPPMAVASDGEHFLVAIRQRAARRDPRQPLRLLRLDASGRRLDDVKALPVLDPGQRPCSHPALAAGQPGSFLVAYQSQDAGGCQRVVARVASVAQAR